MKNVAPPALRLFLSIVVGICAVFQIGCAERKPQSDAQSTHVEASLAEQAGEVKSQRSTGIRIDHALVTDQDLDPLNGLEPYLREINLSRTEITDAGLRRLCQMTHLEQLRLSSSKVTDAGMARLRELKQLRFLHVLDAPITDVGLDELHDLPALESLYLDGTQVTDAGIARLVARLPKIHLHIDDHHHASDPHGADHTH